MHERKQFGQPIGEFQLMQGKLADMYIDHERRRAYVYMCGKAADRGEITRQDAAGCLMYAAEKATWMALEAIQALGGNGYINDYPDRPPAARRQALRDRRRHQRDPADADRAGAVQAERVKKRQSARRLNVAATAYVVPRRDRGTYQVARGSAVHPSLVGPPLTAGDDRKEAAAQAQAAAYGRNASGVRKSRGASKSLRRTSRGGNSSREAAPVAVMVLARRRLAPLRAEPLGAVGVERRDPDQARDGDGDVVAARVVGAQARGQRRDVERVAARPGPTPRASGSDWVRMPTPAAISRRP